MIRQSHFIAVVGTFLMGCVVLLAIGCAGMRSESPQGEQGHTQATTEQTRSDRCEGTRTFKKKWWGGYRLSEHLGVFTTNDVPGCPTSGLLSGTEKADKLHGKKGDDEIHGLDGVDLVIGGDGDDVIYGGPGDDARLLGDDGEDVIYGGDGDDEELSGWGGEDVLYGGDGNDTLDGTYLEGAL